jgi:hypothetical protein
VDTYHAWFDLRDTSKDLEFSDHLERYLDHLKDQGKIQGYRLARRKLGFGPPGLGEFHVAIDVQDLSQLDDAFSLVATREPGIEKLHAAVYTAIQDVTFALYRDFPDPGRVQKP